MVRICALLQAYVGCYHCWMPQSLCPNWEHLKNAGPLQQACQFDKWSLIGMVFMMWYWKGGPRTIRTEFEQRLDDHGVQAADHPGVGQFFGQRAVGGHTVHSELVAAFIWFRRQYLVLGR